MMKFIVEGMSLKEIHEQILESAQQILKTEVHSEVAAVAVPVEAKIEEPKSDVEHKPRVRRTKAQIEADEKAARVEPSTAPSTGADIVPMPVSKAQCQGLLKEICEAYHIDKAREVLAQFKVASVSDMKEYQYVDFALRCRQVLDQKNLE